MKSPYHISFNNNIELGTRITLILLAVESSLSLDELVKLDFILLYSKEFDGPDNLHPVLPNHVAEIAHRREYFPASIKFLISRLLIEPVIDESGQKYQANDTTMDFVSCLQSNYYQKVWKRLNWINENQERLLNLNIFEHVKTQYAYN